MSYLDHLLFGYLPYIAGTIFLLGSVVRFDMSQYTWKTNSSQLLDSSRRFRIANILFHVGIIALFFGHLIGLLMPHSWYAFFGLTAGGKQVLAMTAGGIFGVICLIGMLMLLHRRLTNVRVRAHSQPMDHFILILLFFQLTLGLGTIFVSVDHLDGSVMLMLSEWAQRIVTFQGGAAEAIANVHWIYKAHIFLGLLMFLIFPFTRLVHIWSAPFWYLGRSYQLVRQRQG
ncbi:respiratory nitrate reductase subunit gamma [Ectothiorhodospiraceae bacterium WFHF3C12]|nr:respiratory nitrate reductase subunit gamma [Ectothiorhodospiraceae bacterium WFHF3C12]